MKAVIFDLDGTLIDSAPAIAEIGNTLFAELGLRPMTLPEARSYVGHGAAAFVKKALTAQGHETTPALIERFREIYSDHDGSHNTPYPGAEAVLEWLQAEGFAAGLCTNKPAAPTQKILDLLDWNRHFGVMVGGDSLTTRKPDPEMLIYSAERLNARIDEIVYVGDSEVDAETAQAAGARFVLYTDGYRNSPWQDMPHDVAFTDHHDLPRILSEFRVIRDQADRERL